jgi:endonuclease YncB( thermonuclease family)
MPARSQICTYRNGERWACGQQAYIALLNFIGSAPLGCRSEDTSKPTVVICRLIDKDVSAWMLANGWAYLEKGVTERLYVDAATTGYYAKAGVWAQRAH